VYEKAQGENAKGENAKGIFGVYLVLEIAKFTHKNCDTT